MRDSFVQEDACPSCAHPLDAAADILTDAIPRDGDISLCCNCAIILIFGECRRLRLPTEEELLEMRKQPYWKDLCLQQRALLKFRKSKRA